MQKLSSIAAAFIALLLFQLATGPFQTRFTGFAPLHWQKAVGCSTTGKGLPAQLASPGAVLATEAIPSERVAELDCLSDTVVARGPMVEVEVASSVQGRSVPISLTMLVFRATGPGQEIVEQVNFELDAQAIATDGFTRVRVAIPGADPGDSYPAFQLNVRSRGQAPANALILRSRLNFYNSPLLPQALTASTPLRIAICLLTACALSWCLLTNKGSLASLSSPSLLVLFFAAAFLVHFRGTAFFHWDEWHVFERYQQLGPRGAIYRHNEHFLPLFFGFYYLEGLLFGDAYRLYLLVTLALHALNALLLERVLHKLLSKLAGIDPLDASFTAKLLSLLFVVSAIHSETLHWAFEQSLLLSHILVLLAMLLSVHFVETLNRRSLAAGIACALGAPLLFGNGFALPLQALLFAGCCIVLTQKTSERTNALRRLVVFTACAAAGIALSALLYSLNKDGAGRSIGEADLFGSIHGIASYLFAGSQVGAVLRGLSLYPALQLGSADALAGMLSSQAQIAWPAGISPLLLCAGAGALLSTALLAAAYRRRGAQGAAFWALGQALILAALVLPALGRWQLGANQSLALRYHYSTLAGLAVMLLPILPLTGKKLLGACLTLWISCQLLLGASFETYSSAGSRNRDFAAQLQDWRMKCSSVGAKNYEAQGTSLAGLQPTYPPTVTPGRHPNQIYVVLHWLNSGGYPL